MAERGPHGRPHHGQCITFMAGKACRPESCTGEHRRKADRPPCRQFEAGGCPWNDGVCWFPHVTVVSDTPALPPFNLALQITGGQAGRLTEYLKESFGSMLVAEPIAIRAATVTQAGDTALLIQTTDPGFVVRRLATDVLVAHVAKRWYMPHAHSRSLDDAVKAIAAEIESHCTRKCASAAALRVQCYPRDDEASVMDRLVPLKEDAESATAHAGATLRFSPTAWDLLVACIHVGGWWCTSVEYPMGGDDPALPLWGNMAAKRVDVEDSHGVVSRAYYKLQEALCRTGYVTHPHMAIPVLSPPLGTAAAADEGSAAGGVASAASEVPAVKRGRGPGPMHVAMAAKDGGDPGVHVVTARWAPRVGLDVGASPGGWSQFMARLGFETVYAIDPGDLAPELPLAPGGAILHVRKQALPALAELGSRPELLASVDLYACDMNCEVHTTIEVLRAAWPLLAPGCVCVLTLKNFNGSRRRWEAACQEAVTVVKGLVGGSTSSVWQMHLMSNGPVETTVVVRLPAAGDNCRGPE